MPALGLVVTKLVDAANATEHYTYDGALIPGLQLSCNVPLRLVVDNAYQSPRFYALAPAASLPANYLLLEWWNDSPIGEVPYGLGFRQRFYVDNGALQFLDPRINQDVKTDPDTGAQIISAVSQFAQTAFTIEPVPAYLAQAITNAPVCRFFTADGEDWRLLTTKSTVVGDDGGRWSITATLENQTPLTRRGCTPAALVMQEYDAISDAPRGWHCGDTRDTASDYKDTGIYTCQLGSDGRRTGYALEIYQDYNPYSSSYGQQQTVVIEDTTRCPFLSGGLVYHRLKDNCPTGYMGSDVTYIVEPGTYSSTISQMDADNKGATDVYNAIILGSYANDNGLCLLDSTDQPIYDPNGCFACVMRDIRGNYRDATQEEINFYYVPRIDPFFTSSDPECPLCQ